jgi:hypothetical protein
LLRRFGWGGLALLLALLVAAAMLLFQSFRNNKVPVLTGAALNGTAGSQSLAETPSSALPGAGDPGATADSSQALPADDSAPTQEDAVALAATSTPKYPNGQRFIAYYDQDGFHLKQITGLRNSISSIVFERLDEMGKEAGRFSGRRWAEMYAWIGPGYCMEIELAGRPPQTLAQCQGYSNSTRRLSPGEEAVFWTDQPGSTQFRVLWNNEEVAICEIAAGECEFYVP